MLVGFDSTFLSYLPHPEARAPIDPTTNLPTSHVKERAQGLVKQLQKERHRIIIPAPVTAELLTVIGPGSSEYLQIINRSRVFESRPFDDAAAIELAFLNRDVFFREDRRNRTDVKEKVKFDRQIAAICKVAGCKRLYTDDGSLGNRARLCGMDTLRIYEIPIPEESKQLKLALEQHDDTPKPEIDDDEADPAEAERVTGQPLPRPSP